MYLLPANSPTVRTKWNLGCSHCGLSQRGVATAPQKRMGQLADVAGVPAGTVLAYSASWSRSAWGGGGVIGAFSSINWNDPNGVQSAIQGNLASQYGIVIDSQQHSTSDYINLRGQSGFVLTLHTTSDYGAPADIQSVIDGAIYNVGKTMPQSTIRVVKQGIPQSAVNSPDANSESIAAAQAGYTDALSRGDQASADMFARQIAQLGGKDPRGTGQQLTDFLSNNWPWIAALGVGAVVLKEVA